MKAVRYDRFGGIGHLYVADVPEPAPGPGEVLVRVEAGALNPGALPALDSASCTPGRDLAGEVAAVGEGAGSFAAGDAVLGWLHSWDAHAQLVAIPATQLVNKPEGLSWDVAGSLYTTPMAGLGAVKAVQPRPGEIVVISDASGGVGFTAAQLAVWADAAVTGLTSAGHFGLLRRYGIERVQYGEGEQERIRAAAGQHRVDAFIDAVGGYLDLALALNVPPERIDTVVDYRSAQDKGVKALGTTDTGGLSALSGLAGLAASGDLHIPIAAAYPLTAVQDAYRALASRKAHGRIVLHPQDLT